MIYFSNTIQLVPESLHHPERISASHEKTRYFGKENPKALFIVQEVYMMKLKAFLITILILQANTFAQVNNQTHKQVYPAGINLDYGFGHYSVQDNFFPAKNIREHSRTSKPVGLDFMITASFNYS